MWDVFVWVLAATGLAIIYYAAMATSFIVKQIKKAIAKVRAK
jgi:hypothetical protein